MFIFVHVECDTRFLARGIPSEMPRVDVVAQITCLLLLANARTHVFPIAAVVFAFLQVHTMLEISKVLVVGVHTIWTHPVAVRNVTLINKIVVLVVMIVVLG